jgi:hypothetical protein
MLQRFGFGTKWRAWMRACVCSGNMSVLVNGSPTGEISIKRGLKQGDPLAPLLFLLVAEGLGALMRKAVEINKFRPFLVGRGGLPISILQYADDTLCIGEATVDNLWALKVILRGFEMASGLKVNFWKSSLIGVNVSNDFLDLASNILHCRIGNIPFKYLGLPVGANSRKFSTWEPLLNTLRGRLRSWGSKHVSLGGRIVLINAVLNAILIFYLSFMKMPVKVWKEAVKIQRKFLWGGLSNKNKTCWIKWSDICKPRNKAGLGIRDLRLVNISLLTKWRWKLLLPNEEVWKEVIKAKYEGEVIGNVQPGNALVPRLASKWWVDICNIDKDSDWFTRAAMKKVGNGRNTKFWKEIWVGDQPLCIKFPRLFSMSTQQEEVVGDMGNWVENRWRWNLLWRRSFFQWEETLYRQLEEILASFHFLEHDDCWLWRENLDDGFTVKSCYELLSADSLMTGVLEPWQESVFSNIWKCAAPSKVCAFSWQLLLNRIATKDNLWKRRMIDDQQIRCIHCDVETESATHLFLFCESTSLV